MVSPYIQDYPQVPWKVLFLSNNIFLVGKEDTIWGNHREGSMKYATFGYHEDSSDW